jgi:hypothetical protein
MDLLRNLTDCWPVRMTGLLTNRTGAIVSCPLHHVEQVHARFRYPHCSSRRGNHALTSFVTIAPT